MGESNSTSILQSLTTAICPPQQSPIAPPTPRVTPQNQALLPYNLTNAASVQQNQTAAPSLQQTQVAPRSDIFSNTRSSLLSNRVDIFSNTQASFLSNRAAVLPQQHYSARPYNILAGLNQARVPSFNSLSSPLSDQSLPQVPSQGIYVGGTTSEITRKRRLEALYVNGLNNEIPKRLKHLEAHLVRQIMAEIIDHDATVKWDEIAGLEHAKSSLLETVLCPVLNPKIFQGVRSVGKGVLLFGPPRTGKTMIGKAIAGEMKATFFNICASSLSSKWLGEGENMVRALFTVARHLQPSVIFLDKIDAILFRQSSSTEHEAFRRIKTQILVEMEGIDSESNQIIIIGATNRPQDLDEAARRRLSKRLYIPLLTTEARLQIFFKTMEKGGWYALSEQEPDRISSLTDDVRNGKDIRELEPDDLRVVALQDFENALKEVRPSVSQMELAAFVEWNRKFGSMSL
ncbi:hypothetical protein DITRI_Ditri18aG0014000 [Diplodiscus trichospermus]